MSDYRYLFLLRAYFPKNLAVHLSLSAKSLNRHTDVNKITQDENALLQVSHQSKNTYPLFLVFFSTGNIKRLLAWIKDNLLKERPELFVQGESVYESLSIVNEILHVKCLPGLI